MRKRCGTLTAVCIVAAALAACQSAPTAREHESHTVPLRNEPHRAAVCIARNVDGYRSPYSAHIREGKPPALIEVEVRGQERVAAVELVPDGESSTARVWTTPERPFGLEELVAAMLAGC